MISLPRCHWWFQSTCVGATLAKRQARKDDNYPHYWIVGMWSLPSCQWLPDWTLCSQKIPWMMRSVVYNGSLLPQWARETHPISTFRVYHTIFSTMALSMYLLFTPMSVIARSAITSAIRHNIWFAKKFIASAFTNKPGEWYSSPLKQFFVLLYLLQSTSVKKNTKVNSDDSIYWRLHCTIVTSNTNQL